MGTAPFSRLIPLPMSGAPVMPRPASAMKIGYGTWHSGLREGHMTVADPIIVVLGPWCGGTSAVAKVLHHLGVLMGTRFDVGVRELDDTWEDTDLSVLCRRAFSEPGGQLLMDAHTFLKSFGCPSRPASATRIGYSTWQFGSAGGRNDGR